MSDLINTSKKEFFFISAGFLSSLLIGVFAVYFKSYAITFFPVIIILGTILILLTFHEPYFGLLLLICYSFLIGIPSREIGGSIPYGIGIEFFLLLTWLSVWYNASRYNFKILNNDLIILFAIWFIISVLELVNPAGASPMGWLQEIRSAALYPLLITPLAMLLIDSNKKLNYVFALIIFLSVLASLNGIKQIEFGLSEGEQTFLNDGGNLTHIVNGQLRVFSFYSDAAQFGPAQAFISVITLVLAIGLKGWHRKIILFAVSLLSFYGMLISGTRGAFFVLFVGIILAILLSKSQKVIFIGGAISLLLFFLLKFTYIGNTNYNIYRLRTSLDSEDASLNVRMVNQVKLKEYLNSHPFGGGLGVIGHWGKEYNADKYLSTIPPDSYWVKVWAMYGIVGLIIFFMIWMYLIGKGSAMVWKVKDKNLRIKLIALMSGATGIFLCSYGNEVMNSIPNVLLIQMSMGIVFRMADNRS